MIEETTFWGSFKLFEFVMESTDNILISCKIYDISVIYFFCENKRHAIRIIVILLVCPRFAIVQTAQY